MAKEAASLDPAVVSERALLERMRAGDESAFSQFIEEHGGRLLLLARRLLQNEEDARDAVQDAFLSAFRSLDRFAGDSRVSTWLHRIAVNAALMRLRTRRRHPERSIEDLLPSFNDEGHQTHAVTPWTEPLDETIHRRETRELVRRSIDELPEAYRTVLLLRDIDENDTEETARLLDITPNAVKTRLHRARLALRTLLDAHFRGTRT